MKIEFDSTVDDAATLARVAAALLPEADNEKAPAKPRAAKAAVIENPTSAPSAAKTESPVTPVAAAPAASSVSAPSSTAAPSTDEIIAAANVAVQKVGAGGPGKVKAWIAATFTKADGAPGTLNTVQESQRADLLAKLQQIGQGTLVL